MNVNENDLKTHWSSKEIIELLRIEDEKEVQILFQTAEQIKKRYRGNKVYFRGIIEISNMCKKNCYYCGIRAANSKVERYSMSQEEILHNAMWAFENNYASVVLQGGERTDASFRKFITETIVAIKNMSAGRLGVTLSLGEQDSGTYKEWFAAGAHRYLLRIESSNPALYAKLHPKDHDFQARVACLHELKKIGYLTGTGVMIGLPEQSLEDLANDILFFKNLDVDMIGMGPYVVHKDTPLGVAAANTSEIVRERFVLALKMIAACRIVLRNVNIASTTALQALDPRGRELGLLAGANVIMPVSTEQAYRPKYLLYENKPGLDQDAMEQKDAFEKRIRALGYEIGYGEWGDRDKLST